MNIVISGASRGVGYETALKFARSGNHNIVVISRNIEKLDSLKKLALAENPNATIIPVALDLEQDISEPENVFSSLKHIDILINNAGALVNKPFQDLNERDWQKMFNVNLIGPVKLIQKALPYLGKESKSHIVNISSMGGFQGSAKFPGLAAYSSSKAAIANLTEVLAEEFKEMNIAVNCLAIGAVQTEMLNEAFPGYQAPLQAHEMAEFVCDFSINGSKYINGKILPVSLSTP